MMVYEGKVMKQVNNCHLLHELEHVYSLGHGTMHTVI